MIFIHPTADVSKQAEIGESTSIWNDAQIREDAKIGQSCTIAKGVYIDKGVKVGDKVKVQNYASLFHQAIIEDEVFIGPYVCLTNDLLPRSTTSSGELKKDADWENQATTIKKGASLGAGTIVLPGIEIGEYALVGAGSLVTKDIPSHALVYGSPAKLQGYVCRCGKILTREEKKPDVLLCPDCQKL